MTYDFPGYIADLALAAHKARNTESPFNAKMLEDQLDFAVKDAKRVGEIGDPDKFRMSVATRMVERAGPRLYDILRPPESAS